MASDRLVTLANWQDPPNNRWSFQHVRELIPTAVIRRGPDSVSQLSRDERDLDDLSFQSEGRGWTVRELLDSTETDAFLVLHRGRIVAERYYNAMSEDTTHLLQSVSKSITAGLAGRLVGRGDLDVAAGVVDVLPELSGTSFDGATIQHLLDMRTGTKFNEDYDDPTADVRLYEQVYHWRPHTDTNVAYDAQSYFATLTNDGKHGGDFRYRSILVDVLAWVLERAGNGRFHDLISRELWGPMGAEFNAEVTLDGHGNAMADGGICATLRDLGRFGLLYLNNGQRDGRHVIPSAWIADTVEGTFESRAAFEVTAAALGFPSDAHYRNFWWVYNCRAPLLYAAGIYGQNVFVHAPTQTVVVKLSTWPTPLNYIKLAATRDATIAIGQTLFDAGEST